MKIKYRAWDTETNGYINIYVHDFNYLINNDRYIVQIFTGVEDKNGVEIFEGDIIRYASNGKTCTREVSWDDCKLVLTSNEKEKCDFNKYYSNNCLVVGNVLIKNIKTKQKELDCAG